MELEVAEVCVDGGAGAVEPLGDLLGGSPWQSRWWASRMRRRGLGVGWRLRSCGNTLIKCKEHTCCLCIVEGRLSSVVWGRPPLSLRDISPRRAGGEGIGRGGDWWELGGVV